MPDGGSDNCANCIFNAHWGSYFDPEREGKRARVAQCVLRGTTTNDPWWTYCDLFHGESLAARNVPFLAEARRVIEERPSAFGLDPEQVLDLVGKVQRYLTENRMSLPPVMANGLGGPGYHGRIPWDGPTAPVARATAGECTTCAAQAESTVRIEPPDVGATLVFCSDACYLAWWRTRHPDPPGWRNGPPVVAGRL